MLSQGFDHRLNCQNGWDLRSEYSIGFYWIPSFLLLPHAASNSGRIEGFDSTKVNVTMRFVVFLATRIIILLQMKIEVVILANHTKCNRAKRQNRNSFPGSFLARS